MNRAEILAKATEFYSKSMDANGLPYASLLREAEDAASLEETVCAAARAGDIEVRFESAEINPHIRRLPRHMIPDFEYSYERHGLAGACLYPSIENIESTLDLTRLNNEPYSLRLWAGGNHLDLVFFDLDVLDRYRSDPRFNYQQHFFGGSITLGREHYESETFPEKDKSFVQRFGIAYDADGHRVLGMILSDLRDLTPEHQQAWRSHERTDPCKLNEATFNSIFLGTWSEFGSIFEALPEELRMINEMAVMAFGRPLFKSTFDRSYPPAYGVLLRPTKKEYLDFARVLDEMLSENIDPDFFPGWVPRTHSVERDGRTVEERAGTIQLLDDWLRVCFKATDGDPSADICKPLRNVRAVRSKGSHGGIADVYDHAFEDEQGKLMYEAYSAVRTLRLILTNFPGADQVSVPEWLLKGEIRMA